MTLNSLTSTRTDRVASDSKRTKRSIALFFRDLLVIFVIALLVSFLIKTFLVRSFYTPSASMSDTFLVNDRIIVNQLEPSLIPIERGDVVVFRDPGGWLLPQPPVDQNPVLAGIDWVLSIVGLSAPDSNDHLIKRVVGLPGDTVVCCNTLGQMSVNDVPLAERDISIPAGETKASK